MRLPPFPFVRLQLACLNKPPAHPLATLSPSSVPQSSAGSPEQSPTACRECHATFSSAKVQQDASHSCNCLIHVLFHSFLRSLICSFICSFHAHNSRDQVQSKAHAPGMLSSNLRDLAASPCTLKCLIDATGQTYSFCSCLFVIIQLFNVQPWDHTFALTSKVA